MPWYVHSPTTFDPETGLFSEDLKGLATNPASMAAGDLGAPRIMGESMARVGNGLVVLTIAAAATYTLTVGTGIVGGITSTTSSVDVVATSYTMPVYTGSARFRASHATDGVGGSSSLSLFKNNVLVISFSTSSGTPQPRTVDVSFVPGDAFEWRHRNGPNGSVVSAIFITADDAYQNQLPVIRASRI